MEVSNTAKLIEYIVHKGKDLISKSGKIEDIGVKKQFLTQEDIAIEREIKRIVTKIDKFSEFYAEEENDNFIYGESVWVVDPISGTKLFIKGLKNYAIVASHLTKGETDFAVVYNPTEDKLYVADEDKGVLINNKKIEDSFSNGKKIIYAPSYAWEDNDKAKKLKKELEKEYEIYPSQGSFAINYCLVAEGRFDGVVSLTKDAFPEYAGCYIANKARLRATNISGDINILPTDRAFVCGNENNYGDLFGLVKRVLDS